MKRLTIQLLLGAAACLAAAACAKSTESSTGAVAQEYLGLWMQEYHPGIAAASTGVYILEDEPGTGDLWDSTIPYSRLITSIRSLGGQFSTTGHEAYAKQLGTYVEGNYYGPLFTLTESGYAGVEALLTGMRTGGTRTAVVPAWLLTADRHSTQQEYIDACSSLSSLIYTVTLAGQASDIASWEQEQVAQYAARNFGGQMQAIGFNDASSEADIFYFYSDVTGFKEEDALESGAKYKLNYTGRLLDGTVFDTTLEKVAKDNGIYSSSSTYSTASIVSADSYSDYTMNGSSTLLDGFKGALAQMKYVGQKGVAVFTSDLGYTSTGSGSKIPAYAPLRFDLEIVSVIED